MNFLSEDTLLLVQNRDFPFEELLQWFFEENPFQICFLQEEKRMVFRKGKWKEYKYKKSVICKGGKYYKPEDKKQLHYSTIADLINSCTDGIPEFFGVFWTPNSPSWESKNSFATNKDIINGGKIICQFVDIDAPNEIKKDKQAIKEWKMDVFLKINNHKIKPTLLIETKNGFHVYWKVKDADIKLFRDIQLRLIKEFDADPKCVNEVRLLRLPYSIHRKDMYDPFPIRLVSKNDVIYDQKEFIDLLPPIGDDKLIIDAMKSYEQNRNNSVSDLPNITNIIQRFKERVMVVSENEHKVICHCCMPEHKDNNPSAVLFKENLLFHCAGCGATFFLDELAESLGWSNLLYDIDTEQQLAEWKENSIDIKQSEKFVLTNEEENIVQQLLNETVNLFNDRQQWISDVHKEQIYSAFNILLKAKRDDKPMLINMVTGSGKSTIIKVYIKHKVMSDGSFGCLVVKERRDDVIDFATELNNYIGKEVAYPLYGFDELDCLDNANRNQKKHKSCPVRKGNYVCRHKKNCRYYNQFEEQKKYPIVVLTHKRLYEDARNNKISSNYNSFNLLGQKFARETLIIDEQPHLISNNTLTEEMFYHYMRLITDKFNELANGYFTSESHDDNNPYKKALAELQEAALIVANIFQRNYERDREKIKPVNCDFSFSHSFTKQFRQVFELQTELYNVPIFISDLLTNGGIIERDKKSIAAAHYVDYTSEKNFATIIFDGTALVSPLYKYNEYCTFTNFPMIKEYKNLTFYKCDYLTGTKSNMDNDDVNAFLCDVEDIALDYPKENIYLAMFRDHAYYAGTKTLKSEIKEKLGKYIDKKRIKIGTFGGTKGSNEFRDCTICIIEGFLHKSEIFYSNAYDISQPNETELFTVTPIDQTRRFDNEEIEKFKVLDTLSDYVQEITRTALRDNSRDVSCKVFISSKDKIILELLSNYFPEARVEKWNPKNRLNKQIFSDGRAKNLQLFAEFLANTEAEVLTYAEVAEALGIKDKAFSKMINGKKAVALMESYSYTIDNHKRDGRKNVIVKKYSP
ncbi:DEAD/DEAH box helicase family protein [Heliobacterium undosum]|uniref:DEAD/DEAH box helicase family protein n=1 Tax=Heliomicrobium undosum TaxID=121734 RepID=A0A845L6K8_9FIRM|nr:DEAD/DEAH box helicase family protein [Heliomicrobium undosum]MZP30889.1 DEAD/DEAH box helicase family protein [Heliomicrobium undosum]